VLRGKIDNDFNAALQKIMTTKPASLPAGLNRYLLKPNGFSRRSVEDCNHGNAPCKHRKM